MNKWMFLIVFLTLCIIGLVGLGTWIVMTHDPLPKSHEGILACLAALGVAGIFGIVHCFERLS